MNLKTDRLYEYDCYRNNINMTDERQLDVLDDDWERFKRIMQLGDSDNACTPTATVVQTLQSELLTDAFSSRPPVAKSDAELSSASTSTSASATPKCGPIYISTTTKIAHLNREIDIKRVFWEIPVIRYVEQAEGVIKKQIKFSTTDRDEYDEIMERIGKERCCDNQEIEHIDNPEGRIKFKDQRKISIGISKKDILCYRSKKKRAFFNCFVIIIRILSQDGANLQLQQQQQSQQQQQQQPPSPEFKEMHVKIFNTGKLEIPGIQNAETLEYVLGIVTRILKSAVSPTLSYMPGECETVLINSNFNCGFYIDRDRLHEILKYKYRINSNYDSCSYPGIQSKFYYVYGNAVQNGQQPHYYKDKEKEKEKGKDKDKDKGDDGIARYCEISFMIFRTGSVLIVGKCTEDILHTIYNFLKTVLEDEYEQIVNRDRECGEDGQIPEWTPCPKKVQTAKIQRRVITCSEVHGDGL